MKILTTSFLLLLASCSTMGSAIPAQSPQVAAGGATPASAHRDSRVTIYLGQRSLDEDDYSPIEDQVTFGVEYAREPAGSAIGWEVGLLGSSDETTIAGFDIQGRTAELYGGVRKTFGSGVARPFVGGGLSFINSEVEISGIGSADDSSPAAYAHVGIAFDVTPSFFLGADLRSLFGSDMTIAGFNTDADYTQLALYLGWSF